MFYKIQIIMKREKKVFLESPLALAPPPKKNYYFFLNVCNTGVGAGGATVNGHVPKTFYAFLYKHKIIVKWFKKLSLYVYAGVGYRFSGENILKCRNEQVNTTTAVQSFFNERKLLKITELSVNEQKELLIFNSLTNETSRSLKQKNWTEIINGY